MKKTKKKEAPSARGGSHKKAAAEKKPAARASLPDAAKVRKVKEMLQQELIRLKKRLGMIQHDEHEDSGIDAMNVGDIVDAASHQETRAVLLGLHQTEMEQYKQIEAALKRIDSGTYGRCTLCSEPIETARLDAIPYALTCITCKRKEESGELARSR